jgi:hypothetical protein
MITVGAFEMHKSPELAEWVLDRLGVFAEESEEITRIGIDRDTVKAAMEHKNVRAIFSFKDGEAIGVILFFVNNPWFNKTKKSITDLVMWVDKDHRGCSAFVKMVMFLEAIAAEEGIPFICLSQSTGIEVEKTSRLFEKMGYSFSGMLTFKEIKHVSQ